MKHLGRALAAALLVPMALAACLFVPGKFASTLDIRADRSFTFTYKGEVAAVDIAGMMGKAMAQGFSESVKTDAADNATDGESSDALDNMTDAKAEESPAEKAKKDAEYRDLAKLVAKEAGYRSVEYRGNGVFYVDYAISGKLTHNFVFPYNQDAEMVFPFLAIELRGKDAVRVKAPGFGKQDTSAMGGMGSGGGGGADELEAKLDGTFTLTTNAELVSQNNEDGAQSSAAGKTVSWKVNRNSDAPMAVLRVSGL